MPLTLAYYCSGHGYGHATRVSAFASHLLELDNPPTVHIVSSAPAHVFQDSIALGARYRSAFIDPVVVQPVAYRVDREKSVEALRAFLCKKEELVREEAVWLEAVGADCVLSDAAFLAFLAADRVRIPSVLITNFTFDSVFSYLSYPVDQSHPSRSSNDKENGGDDSDEPIPEETLEPLVREVYDGYRHADRLLCLPGHIPIPSFAPKPALPAPRWIDSRTRTFDSQVVARLYNDDGGHEYATAVHPSPPFSSPSPFPTQQKRNVKPLPREIVPAPLLVRPPSADVYTPAGRARVLSALGVPPALHDARKTRILVVSFGGQVFHVPRSRTPSRPASFVPSPDGSPPIPPLSQVHAAGPTLVPPTPTGLGFSGSLHRSLSELAARGAGAGRRERKSKPSLKVFSPSHIYVPGAPAPASLPASPISPRTGVSALEASGAHEKGMSAGSNGPGRVLVRAPSNDFVHARASEGDGDAEGEGDILPDESWIAIVCGASAEDGGEMAEGFYVAPKDVYMPDLMAVADVLLGKLGYGTVAECVDSCTPFVYVSRPLFVEEHGLRLYLDRAGVGVEMAQEEYEAGNWAACIADAWARGGERKMGRREGAHAVDRRAEGRQMAIELTDWVEEWGRRTDGE